jgi:hypothetical protein
VKKILWIIILFIITAMPSGLSTPVQAVESATIHISSATVDSTNGFVSVRGTISSGPERRVTLVVKNPIGKKCGVDQVWSTDFVGNFVFEYKLAVGSIDGIYDVYVGGSNVAVPSHTTFELSAMKNPPVATNVTIEGESKIGAVLTANFDFFHFGSAPEENSVYRWISSSTIPLLHCHSLNPHWWYSW